MAKTSNYDQFQILESNRKINGGLVARLKDSIHKIGYIESKPILVTKNMEIIDGQHRFYACKELKLPVVFSINNSESDINEIVTGLNSTQLIWRLSDYIEHYAKLGVKYHKTVLDFEQKHHYGISCSITICSNVIGTFAKEIRAGKNLSLYPNRDDVAIFVNSCRNLAFYKSAHFVRAVCVLFRKTNEVQREKLLKNILLVTQQASSLIYLKIFENIINKNMDQNKRISLQ